MALSLWQIHRSIVIVAKELAKADGKFWVALTPEERNDYYAKASNLPKN